MLRGVLALLAFVVGVLSAMAVGIGVMAALLTGTIQDPPGIVCEEACPEDAEPVAILVAQVAGAHRERLDLDVEDVERGDVDGDISVRSYGVALSPWSRYRVALFEGEAGPYVTDQAPPEPVGRSMPAGWGAFSALTPSTRWAVASMPALLASLWGFWVVSRHR
jgi:hypothetical protein